MLLNLLSEVIFYFEGYAQQPELVINRKVFVSLNQGVICIPV